MNKTIALFLCLLLAGCTTVHIPGYIEGGHPYTRKMYGNYDRIVVAVKRVLVRNKWKIQGQMRPEVYERSQEDGRNADKSVLLFTDIKQHSMVLYSSYTHLNVYVYAVADGAQVEIRYGKVTPLLIKQMRSTREDKLAERLLEQIEQDLVEGQ